MDDKKPIVKKITGSTGIHTVRMENERWSCTCDGFKFRGNCKHVTNMKNDKPQPKE